MNMKNQDLAIQVQDLSKDFPGRKAVDSISFNVKKGTIHGFLGPNGAGKSTTMRILTDLLSKTSGEVKVFGRIGFLPEMPPLYENMTVDAYLKFVLEIQTQSNNNSAIDPIKVKCGLTEVGNRIIGNLSKGFRQRVAIAGALVSNPEIIILDEPTVGLDPNAILEIRNLINDLKKEHTILFSSHQLYEVEQLCTDITLIHEGKILFSGNKEDMLSKFSQRFEYILKTYSEIPSILKEFASEYLFEFESINSSVNNYDWKIKPKQNLNALQLKELTKKLANSELGLLSFQEKRLDLEEVFKLMTKGIN